MICIDYFIQIKSTLGESIAPVADCNSEEFCAHPKTNMSVKDYMTYWQSHRQQRLCENGEQGLCDKTDCLYLKDWHFMRYSGGNILEDIYKVLRGMILVALGASRSESARSLAHLCCVM